MAITPFNQTDLRNIYDKLGFINNSIVTGGNIYLTCARLKNWDITEANIADFKLAVDAIETLNPDAMRVGLTTSFVPDGVGFKVVGILTLSL